MKLKLPPSPFKGLSYFGDSEGDWRFFFGRERESELVAANLMATRLTVLYGPSGVGKSSLLRAGVTRRLRSLVPAGLEADGGADVVIVDRWRDDPVAAVLAAAGARTDVPLADALTERAAAVGGELYVVLDQMEEYVLYHGRDGGPLAPELEDVLTRTELPVHVLLGVRDDALADLDALKRRVPGLFNNVLRLDHLTRAAARSAIEGPLRAYAELGGAEVTAEDELVEAVLDQVAAGRIERHLTGRGLVDESEQTRRVEAPYLQLVLERLWAVERERGSNLLRASTLVELGGAERIVERHLERALEQLGEDERDLVGSLFNYLVTPSGTKIAHAVDDLARYAKADPARLEHALGTLEGARILRRVPGRSGGPHRYEIFHDVLAPPVLAWRDDREREAERAAARRRHRRLGFVTALALVALAGTLALAAWALGQRADARKHARTAEAGELASSALSQLAVDPERSLGLALRAAELQPSVRTEDVLRRSLLASRLLRTLAVEPAVEQLAFAPSGEILAASGGRVRRLGADLSEHATVELPGRLLELRGDGAVVVSGRTVSIVDPVTGRVERRMTVPVGVLPRRDALSGELTGTIPAPKEIRLAALGPERTLLALSDGTRRTVVLNALTGDGRYLLEQPSAVTSLRFGPAARTLAVGGSDGSVRLWRVSTGEHRATLRFGHVGHVTDIAFSPRATLLATASTDGTARVWRVGSAEAVSVLPAHENFVNDVEFSRDGSFVVTAGKDGTARTWGAETGDPQATLSGHGDSVVAASFLPDGRRVVTAGVDGTVRLWNAVRQPALRLVRRYDEPVTGVRFAGGRIEATVADRVHVLDGDGRELATRAHGPDAVERAPDGATLTIAGKTVLVRRPAGGQLVLAGHRDAVTSARFSPDGRLVVTASRDHDPIVWDASSGRAVRKLLGHFAIVSDAAFSPDGRWIVTAGPGKAGLWDASTGALVYFLQGHEDILLSAAFDPTSRVIVTGGKDGTVRTWGCAICAHVDGLIRVAHARLAARGAPKG